MGEGLPTDTGGAHDQAAHNAIKPNLPPTPEFASRWERIFSEAQEIFGVTPVAILLPNDERLEIKAGEAPDLDLKKPFAYIEVASPEHPGERMVLKAQFSTNEIDTKKLDKEILLRSKYLPDFYAGLPETIRSKFRAPQILPANAEHHMFLEEFYEKPMSGGIHHLEPGKLTRDDVIALAEYMYQLRLFGQARGAEMRAEMDVSHQNIGNVRHKYGLDMERTRKVVTDLHVEAELEKLGITDIAELLTQNDAMFSDRKHFMHANFQPSRVYKNDNGTLTVREWSRACESDNPGFDISTFFAMMWSEPELQEIFFQESLRLNADIPNLKLYILLDYIFNREEVWHWKGELAKETTVGAYRTFCELAVNRIQQQVKNAVLREGIWK